VVPGRSTKTWLAVGVPGTVAGLEYARSHYGTRTRDELIAPAIRIAQDGFVLDAGDIALFAQATQDFASDPAAAAIFLNDGRPFAEGDRLRQPDLAHTLERISLDGPGSVYGGPIGAAIVSASTAGGGLLAPEDFTRYAVRELPTIGCDYRGYQVISAPPPSSGGVVLCEILGVLEGFDLHKAGFHSAAEVHLMVEAMRRAYFDRNNRLGDPAFVSNPVTELLSRDYTATLRDSIDPARATPSSSLHAAEPGREGTQTTEFAVVDAAGNAVSVTYTLNSWFGVRKVAPGTGVLLNNEMDDFTAKPGVANMFGLVQGSANAVAPGKTPLSSMTPTIVTKDGHLVLVLGSPGGSRIITTVLETLVNVIDHAMTIQEAIDAPRVHHQWLPDTIYAETGALSADTRAVLVSEGYTITDGAPWGIAEGILAGKLRLGEAPPVRAAGSLDLGAVALSGSGLFGAHDPRGPTGLAAGE
jgi:gamma-glutamyltranspeptidase/glutathione hydrolase